MRALIPIGAASEMCMLVAIALAVGRQLRIWYYQAMRPHTALLPNDDGTGTSVTDRCGALATMLRMHCRAEPIEPSNECLGESPPLQRRIFSTIVPSLGCFGVVNAHGASACACVHDVIRVAGQLADAMH